MTPVVRDELLSLGAYEEIREHFRARVIALKQNRRISLGNHLTLVFENRDTVLFQIQEMLRTERITDEHAIAHELATYNELMPDTGDLSATLFIEYEDKQERARMLSELTALRHRLALHIGKRAVLARFLTQPGEEEDRIPAVCYIRFALGLDAATEMSDITVSAKLRSTVPAYTIETPLPRSLRIELARDLLDR